MSTINTNIHPAETIELTVGKPSTSAVETLKITCRTGGQTIRTTYFIYDTPRERLLAAVAAFTRIMEGK